MGERARQVWHALSRAVHQCAYELQPSIAELQHLVGLLGELGVGSVLDPHRT